MGGWITPPRLSIRIFLIFDFMFVDVFEISFSAVSGLETTSELPESLRGFREKITAPEVVKNLFFEHILITRPLGGLGGESPPV